MRWLKKNTLNEKRLSAPVGSLFLLPGVFILFGAIFFLVSIPNHYNFRTYAFDLGINNNAIWDYMHFRWNHCTVMDPHFTNVLSDHFSLLPILISPFAWIFGTYTLLLFQLAAVLYGGYGIYCLVEVLYKSRKPALLALLHFFSMWGIFSVLAFDYHDNVMGAMFVPWFLYFIHLDRPKQALPWFILILISKENIALWMVFICLGMLWLYKNDRMKRKSLAIFGIAALVYFLVVMEFIMPALADPGRTYLHFDYQAIGSTFREAFVTLATRPLYSFKLLFINHLPDPLYDGIKAELWLAVLLSGGLALIRKPQFLLMLLPVFAQKLYSDHYEYWGINNHYSIEFVPILTLAVYWSLLSIPSLKTRHIIGISLALLTLGSSMSFIDHRVSKHYKRGNSRFYQKTHYVRNYNVKEVHSFISKLPVEAKISAQNMLVPHLAFRDEIYTFPTIEDADYIVLLPADDDKYPFTGTDYEKKLEEIKKMPGWNIKPSPASMLVLEKQQEFRSATPLPTSQ